MNAMTPMTNTYEPRSCTPAAKIIIAMAAITPPINVPKNRNMPRLPDPPTVDCKTNTAPIADGPTPPGKNSALMTSAIARPNTAALEPSAASLLKCVNAASIVGAFPSGLFGGNPSGSASALEPNFFGNGACVNTPRNIPPPRRAYPAMLSVKSSAPSPSRAIISSPKEIMASARATNAATSGARSPQRAQ